MKLQDGIKKHIRRQTALSRLTEQHFDKQRNTNVKETFDIDIYTPFGYHCTIATNISNDIVDKYIKQLDKETKRWRNTPSAWRLPFHVTYKVIPHVKRNALVLGEYVLNDFEIGQIIYVYLPIGETRFDWFNKEYQKCKILSVNDKNITAQQLTPSVHYSVATNWKTVKATKVIFKIRTSDFLGNPPLASKVSIITTDFKNLPDSKPTYIFVEYNDILWETGQK